MKRQAEDKAPEYIRPLAEWLIENNINMSPQKWIEHCLKKLGLVTEDKVTAERFRGVRRK